MTQDIAQESPTPRRRVQRRWHAPRLGALLIAALFALTLASLAAQTGQSARPTC